jgi:ATP-dependent RNA helicase DeaD
MTNPKILTKNLGELMTLSFQELGISQERVEQLEKIGFTEPTNQHSSASNSPIASWS